MDRRAGVETVGARIAFATTAVTLGTFAVAVLTPPLSGPFCATVECYSYPYADIAARFPRDYLWMFPAMALRPLYVALIACVYRHAPDGQKLFGLFGLSAAIVSAAVLPIDYFLQVTVVQPGLLAGEPDRVPILTQFNPHGVFIALEELGQLIRALSFLCVAPVFSGENGLERALRWILTAGFLTVPAALVVISLRYGVRREYRFEVAAIAVDWLVLAAAGLLIGRAFGRGRTGGGA